MDNHTAQELKDNIKLYCQIKDNLKRLTEQKKNLEQYIINTMNEYDLTTVELPDGNVLNYQMKESISVGKEKAKAKSKKAPAGEDD